MFNDTPLWIVEDDQRLREVAKRLAKSPAIGVDTESDSFYSYQEKVCLLQISDLDTDYVIDPLAVKDLSPLAPIMADPRIVKVFHGADYDVVCLRRDYGFDFHNIFDTMIASQLLGLPKLGLADLIGEYFGLEIDKKYQRHDWSLRPLLDDHIEYARGDSHWLPALREILIRLLVRRGRLDAVEEECALIEQRAWEPRAFNEDGYLKVKTAKGLNDQEMRILRRLYLYRDGEGRKMNRPVFKVIGDRDLVAIAKGKPTTKNDLERVLPGKHGLKRRHADALIECVVEGKKDTFEIPDLRELQEQAKASEAPSEPVRLRGRSADRLHEELKLWRNRLVKSDTRLSPVAVISNSVLREIARVRPRNAEELAAVQDVRRWQVREFGKAILAVIDKTAPWSDKDEASFQKKLAKWDSKQALQA